MGKIYIQKKKIINIPKILVTSYIDKSFFNRRLENNS